MKYFKLTDTKTGKIAIIEAENALEVVKKYDLATIKNAHIKVIELQTKDN